MTSTRYVFLIGTGRCGSTLLARLLCEHASIGFVSGVENQYGLPARLQSLATSVYQSAPKRLWRGARSLEPYPAEAHAKLAREVSPMIVSSARDLLAADASPWIAERTRRFFEQRARMQRRPVFAHKFTGWPKARFLHRVFPKASFVHLVRDGRAVANSLIQRRWWSGFGGPEAWGWGPLPEAYARHWEESDRSFVVLAAIEWMILMDAFRAARAEIPNELWLEVRYEDLVADPRRTTMEILGFMGLEWTDQFEARFAQRALRTDRSDAYLRDLDPGDVEWLDAILAEHLRDLGY